MSATWVKGEDGRMHLVEQVNRPAHYTQGGIECIDAIRAQLSEEEYRGYLRGNIAKYMWRYRGKNKVEDLMKAEVYLGWLMKLEGHSTDKPSDP
jgi:hypothetical protein